MNIVLIIAGAVVTAGLAGTGLAVFGSLFLGELRKGTENRKHA